MDNLSRFFLMCFFLVIATSNGQNYVLCEKENIAIGKNYRISSKYPREGQFSESDAANGNTSTYFPGNCIHTAVGDPGWWEVDLGTSYPVYSIKVWGRNGAVNRMYPFNITVDGTPCSSMENGTLVQSVTCSSVITGRRVRFHRTGGDCCLNLCELQIYVCSPGWYGAECDKRCLSDRCYQDRCDQQTGLCTECDANLTGNYCSIENIATGRSYNISSTYGNIMFKVSDAANGNTSTYFPGNCIHTAIGDPGWWEVDLGTSYPVYTITFWGRTGAVDRMYPFTITVDGTTCTTMQNGQLVQSVTCSSVMMGRRFRFHRTGGDCCLNLCELQIYVCVDGYYGVNCTHTCSPARCQRCDRLSGKCSVCNESFNLIPPSCSECAEGYFRQTDTDVPCTKCTWQCHKDTVCDRHTGNCDRCPPGMQGPRCHQACDDYVYGDNCSIRCGNCLNNQTCNKTNGHCLSCTVGRQPPLCQSDCPAGTYGAGCSSKCGHCQDYATCHNIDGTCTACEPGWYHQPLCQTPCADNTYGLNCTGKCGNCSNNTPCNKTNGHCPTCPAGLQPPLCQSGCENRTYGEGCEKICGQCKDGLACDKANGTCTNCEPGWYLPECRTACANNTYGDHCSQKCGNCSAGRACNNTNGYCPACPVGLQPPLCQTACGNRTYGPNCNQACGNCLNDTACHPVSGECTAGCAPGYYDTTLCLKACEDGWYGTNCSQPCGPCKDNATCSKTNGHCPACPQGMEGSLCTAGKDSQQTGTVAGAVVGSLAACVVLAVAALFLVRRWRQNNLDKHKNNSMSGLTSGVSNNNYGVSEPTYSNTDDSFTNLFQDDQSKGKTQTEDKHKVISKTTPQASGDKAVYENVVIKQKDKTATKLPLASDASHSNTTVSSTNAAKHKIQTERPAAKAANSKSKSEVIVAKTSSAAKLAADEPDELPDDEEKNIYYNDGNRAQVEQTVIPLDSLQQVVKDKIQNDSLSLEFSMLVPQKDYPVTSGQKKENHYKNRFNSILPYEHTRIQLVTDGGDDQTDYINANFVKGIHNMKAYIAAQGPRDNTVNDFWLMIWQEGVTDIVMLTNVMEGNKPKCHEYWPSKNETLRVGHITVTTLEEKCRAFFVVRSLQIKQSEGTEKRLVMQYHYVNWLDHEVPASTPLVDFWRYVRARVPRNDKAPPLLVHCSAGVGRTGTYIALDVLMDQAEKQSQVDIYTCVQQLREYRCQMVQNKGQYQFLHEAFVEAYTSRDTRISSDKFKAQFPQSIRPKVANKRIDAEFETMIATRGSRDYSSCVTASLEENRAKNRNESVLPDDSHLVYLTSYMRGRNQYINAVYCPTIFRSRGCILTQLPLRETVIDMWRMIEGCDVNTVVSVGDIDEKSRYWPSSIEPLRTGSYTVALNSMTKIGETLCSYNLSMTKEDKSNEVQVLHLTGWTGQVANNTDDLIHLLTLLHTCQVETPASPVVVQCSDGASHSGVVCALLDVISRVTSDGEVDVHHAVRQVTTSRPEAVINVEQYRFCYSVVHEYLKTENLYGNI